MCKAYKKYMREFCASDVGKIANRIMQKEEMARISENNALCGFRSCVR